MKNQSWNLCTKFWHPKHYEHQCWNLGFKFQHPQNYKTQCRQHNVGFRSITWVEIAHLFNNIYKSIYIYMYNISNKSYFRIISDRNHFGLSIKSILGCASCVGHHGQLSLSHCGHFSLSLSQRRCNRQYNRNVRVRPDSLSLIHIWRCRRAI